LAAYYYYSPPKIPNYSWLSIPIFYNYPANWHNFIIITIILLLFATKITQLSYIFPILFPLKLPNYLAYFYTKSLNYLAYSYLSQKYIIINEFSNSIYYNYPENCRPFITTIRSPKYPIIYDFSIPIFYNYPENSHNFYY